jgi:hypothetical protein
MVSVLGYDGVYEVQGHGKIYLRMLHEDVKNVTNILYVLGLKKKKK